MSILILATLGDIHTQAVQDILTKRGEECIVYDPGNYPENAYLGVYVGKETQQAGLWTEQGSYNLAEVTAVYDRSSAHTPPIREVRKGLTAYIQSEAQTFLLALYSIIPHAFWLSNPYQTQLADIKLHQLRVAQSLGFKIPETAMGNAPEIVRALIQHEADDQKSFVLKPLRRKLIEYEPNMAQRVQKYFFEKKNAEALKRYKDTDTWLWEEARYRITQEVPVQQFTQHDTDIYLTHLPSCPVIIQHYTPKKLELRITIVGEEVFPCAIYSQDAPTVHGKIDWRGHEDDIRHERYHLPPEIQERCLALMKAMELEFGAIDMVVTPNDEYVFLEINTNGQWLWVQDKTGFPIAESIANRLIQK